MLGRRVELNTFHFDVEQARSAAGLARLWRRQHAWLRSALPEADLVFGWFADYHMALPVRMARRRGIPTAVSLGGYDCIHLPALGYGVYESRWRAPLARYVLGHASMLLPVAEGLLCSENRFSDWPHQRSYGLCAHAPSVNTPARVVPTGYVPDRWPAGPPVRGKTIATVGLIDSDVTLRRKGIDLVFDVAPLLPDCTFRIIGVAPHMHERIRAAYRVPANVALEDRVPREELAAAYREASVYLQLSRAEGMPNVLCEAMLCGCVPVASRVFGNPAGVGDAGFLVDDPRPETVAAAIRQAMDAGPDLREQARRHILDRFQRAHREQALMDVFTTLASRE